MRRTRECKTKLEPLGPPGHHLTQLPLKMTSPSLKVPVRSEGTCQLGPWLGVRHFPVLRIVYYFVQLLFLCPRFLLFYSFFRFILSFVFFFLLLYSFFCFILSFAFFFLLFSSFFCFILSFVFFFLLFYSFFCFILSFVLFFLLLYSFFCFTLHAAMLSTQFLPRKFITAITSEPS